MLVPHSDIVEGPQPMEGLIFDKLSLFNFVCVLDWF